MNAAIINDLNYCKLCTAHQFEVATTIVAGPTPLSATPREFRYAVVTALKSQDGTANTGAVKLGASPSASKQPILLNEGDSYVIQAPNGAKFNYQNWYFTVANDADGLVVWGA